MKTVEVKEGQKEFFQADGEFTVEVVDGKAIHHKVGDINLTKPVVASEHTRRKRLPNAELHTDMEQVLKPSFFYNHMFYGNLERAVDPNDEVIYKRSYSSHNNLCLAELYEIIPIELFVYISNRVDIKDLYKADDKSLMVLSHMMYSILRNGIEKREVIFSIFGSKNKNIRVIK